MPTNIKIRRQIYSFKESNGLEIQNKKALDEAKDFKLFAEESLHEHHCKVSYK